MAARKRPKGGKSDGKRLDNGAREKIRDLLEHSGVLYSEELGIDLARGGSRELFEWLCAAKLFGARIGSQQAARAARALFESGLNDPKSMAMAGWDRRTSILNHNGYARFDGKTSNFLGDMAEGLLREYGGDLRKLREKAGRNPGRERDLLEQFKGMGDTSVDIFFREAQLVWNELLPFLDKRARKAAAQLGLPDDPGQLAELVKPRDFPRLAAALVRESLS